MATVVAYRVSKELSFKIHRQ